MAEFYLHQILPIFFLPLGVSLILILAGLLFRRRALVWTAVTILWLSSIPPVSARLMRATEEWAERTPATEAPAADAIVVLSYGRVIAPGGAGISEWADPDRFFGGIELFQAGKAPLLVFTGGWSPSAPEAPLEGDVLTKYAKALGIPPDRIVTTGRVVNTAEEAGAVAALLRERDGTLSHVLLVTSAIHMPRARQLFERAGLLVTAFPVDFQTGAVGGLTVTDLLPSAGSLGQTQRALRELYGRLFYLVVSR